MLICINFRLAAFQKVLKNNLYMNFSKFRNTNPISKGLVTIIIILGAYFTSIAQTPLPNTNTPVPTTTTKNDDNKVDQQTPTNNRTTTINRIPETKVTDTRIPATTKADAEAIAIEEQTRLVQEAEMAKDLEKTKIINRTFGSSLFKNSKVDPAANINVATPSNYVLGPGDKLNIDIYGYSQYKQVVTINPDGFVVLEKAGIVNILGLNIDEAERKITASFSKIFLGLNSGNGYAANTFLKVSLTGYRSIKIKITGEVIAPGTYTVTSFTSILNALFICGGPNEIGTYRNIKLIRGNRQITTLDLYDVIINGYSKGDMLLKDQDVIQVGPYMSRIAVEGYVKRKGLFELDVNENLSKVISYAGGFDQYAYTDRIKIYRNTQRERKILDVKFSEFKGTQIQSGDSIVVEKLLERFENLVTVNGAVYRPGEYSLESNPTLLNLINSAEGLRDESLQGRVTIVRTNDDLSISNISVNLAEVKDGRITDPKLKRQDLIVVPSIFDLTEPSYIRIQGAINNPLAKEGVEVAYVKDMTIQDLLVRVGGVTEAASLTKVEIVRRKRNVDINQIDAQISDIIEFEIKSDLSLNSSDPRIVLLPFDEIFIRTSPNYEKQNFITLKGEVLYPGKYGIKYKDEKISDVIKRAGKLTPIAYIKGATLVRKTLLTDFQRTQREDVLSNLNLNTKVKAVTEADPLAVELTTTELETKNNLITESIGIDLERILLNPGSVEDIILQDGDEINIPTRLQTVRVEGEILYPTTVKFLPNLKFIDYISRSGGFTKKSLRSRAFVIYPNGSVDRTRKFLFVKIYPKVEPGSEIIIPGKTENGEAQFNRFATLIGTVSGTLATIVTIVGILQLNKNN